MNRFVWIVATFALLVVLLAFGLTQDPSRVPSPLIGKPLPNFVTTALGSDTKQVDQTDLKGPAVINVWASWCVACLEEHPLLMTLAQHKTTPIYGINYKDAYYDAQVWLEDHGNPYRLSLSDSDGRVGIEFGVYAVPETFVIDATGVIRYKHIGPLNEHVVQTELQPLLETLTDGYKD